MKRFLVLLLSLSPAPALAADAAVNFQEPPYWMVSYDEMEGLREVEKNVYMDGLLEKVTRLPSLKKLNRRDLDESAGFDETWEALMTKAYTDCQAPENRAACEDLKQARLTVLNMFALPDPEKTEPELNR